MRVSFTVTGSSHAELQQRAYELLDEFDPDGAGKWSVGISAQPLTMDYRLWVGECEAERS